MRNLNVAIGIGVNPSLSAILTTTEELPQKIISVNIRSALSGLIVLVFMLNVCLLSVYRGFSWKIDRLGVLILNTGLLVFRICSEANIFALGLKSFSSRAESR